MANQINNRIFGGDIPIRVKKTLEARQFLSHKNRKPGDEINPSAYTDPDKSSYKFNELINFNFDGVSDLSSRTPFARLWTAVNVSTDVLHKELSKEDAEKWETDKDAAGKNDADYKDKYLKEIGESSADKKYEVHQWVPVEDSEKIYVLGNHLLGTEQVGPNTPRTVSAGDVPAGVMKELLYLPRS